MRYADIKFPDIANGPGCRVSLWISGCHFHCEDCHNQELWDFNAGDVFDLEAESKILNFLKLDYCEGLSILGGEPLELINNLALHTLLMIVKSKFPNKSIWVYTGYKFEDIKHRNIMKYIDVLVDGQFEKDKKIVDLKFRGSTNQRKIDVQKSLITGETVELEF